MNSFWNTALLGNTVKDWMITIGIIIVASLAFRIIREIIIKKMQALAEKTSSSFDDFLITVLRRSITPFLYAMSFFFGLKYLHFPEKVNRILQIAMLTIATWYVIKIISAFIGYFFQQFASNNGANASKAKQAKGMLLIVKIILWIAGIIFLVDNLGYDITTIITGLGIGGIAIALAAQAILGDLFSYLVIFFDKPFESGDFIVVGDKSGVVEHVGIKTTRLRTLDGEQLIISNTDLTNSRVQNFKRMEKRRSVFAVGVTYETPAEKLRKIPVLVKNIVDNVEGIEFDRAHFSSFGDFSLNFEIVYYALSSDFLEHMDRRQLVLLGIAEAFEKEGIDFAYPTQTLIVSNPEKKVVRPDRQPVGANI
ncbi:MAG: mechanosensitive ion channel family protein [Agriterribacter sp.]